MQTLELVDIHTPKVEIIPQQCWIASLSCFCNLGVFLETFRAKFDSNVA